MNTGYEGCRLKKIAPKKKSRRVSLADSTKKLTSCICSTVLHVSFEATPSKELPDNNIFIWTQDFCRSARSENRRDLEGRKV
ncbi:MAG: hypothetical protein FWF77_03530, partial [Defluviitaleaceae bacterium]|nr:hypothetical protein [Defluviitaleaceae bacterium]